MIQVKFDPPTDPELTALFKEIETSFEYNPTLSHIDGPIFPYEPDCNNETFVDTKEMVISFEDGPKELYQFDERIYDPEEGSVTFTNLRKKE